MTASGSHSQQQDFIDAYSGLFRDAYRVAFRLLGDREEAEDIAQEACIRACQRWRRLSEGGYAAPWVVRVSTNLSLDRWRSTPHCASSLGNARSFMKQLADTSDARRCR